MPYSMYTCPEDKYVPTRNVSLPEALDKFVEETIKTGRYDNASEVVRSGLRLLQEEERVNREKFTWLKTAIAEGLASGSEDSEVAFTELDQYMDDLVASKKPGRLA